MPRGKPNKDKEVKPKEQITRAAKDKTVKDQERKSNAGAKGKYAEWVTEDGLLRLKSWARDGYTDEQIATSIGIHVSTLYEWKNKYSELAEALKSQKDVVDIGVEDALYKKTQGYNAKILKTFKLKKISYDSEGRRCEEEYLQQAEDEVHIPADTTAQIFWLKNRQPTKWRDKQDVEHSGSLGVKIVDDIE